jgi:hypothetical protein
MRLEAFPFKHKEAFRGFFYLYKTQKIKHKEAWKHGFYNMKKKIWFVFLIQAAARVKALYLPLVKTR